MSHGPKPMGVRSRWALRAKRHSAFSVALRGPRLLLRVKMLLAEWNTVWARRRLMHGSSKTQYWIMITLGGTFVVRRTRCPQVVSKTRCSHVVSKTRCPHGACRSCNQTRSQAENDL